jgi:2-polyprenyl-3-methyl-5-hydroxy-6-metoxy-1,4-benzoquinol methylase
VTREPAAARHFAAAADRYGQLRNTGILGRIRRQEQRAVRELAPIGNGETVLDAGCGDGDTMRWIEGQGAVAVGIDLSLPMARASAAHGLRVAVQDMEAVGIRPAFDWVLCIGSLEFVADPGVALGNLASCLVPRGRMVLLYPRKGVLGSLYRLYHRSHDTPIHTLTSRSIESLLVAAGFAPPSAERRCLLANVCVTRLVEPGHSGRLQPHPVL